VAIGAAGSTVESGEPWLGGGPYGSVWFKYTPSTTQTVQLSAQGFTDSGRYTAVYTGSSLGGLTSVVQVYGEVSWRALAGTQYYIQVGTNLGHGTAGTLVVTAGSAGNDDFADAATLAPVSTGFASTWAIDATMTTVEPAEPWLGGGPYASIWFKYTPLTTQTIALDAYGYTTSGRYTSVYSGATLGSLSLVHRGYGTNSFTATPGTTYFIQVGAPMGTGGPGHVELRAS
jgi:hypothetical protein